MVLDFVDDNRTDAGAGVAGAEAVGDLGGPLLVAGADHIAPEAHSIGRGAIIKAVTVSRQVGGGIAGEEKERLTVGTQPEAGWHAGLGVELGPGEDGEAARGNG